MAAPRVRRAVPGDAPALALLRWEFRAELGQAREPFEEFVGRAAPWIADRLAGGSAWRAWIAVAPGGEPAGCLWLQLVEKVPNPGEEEELHGYLTAAYVRPAWRGGGTGGALLAAALEACRAAGVDTAFLWPTSRSRTLYERFGFRPPADMLALQLGAGRHLP